MLDSGFGHLSNQQTFYVQLSRARENAVVLTDNREQLVETLEANTGERITALDAIGEAAVREVPAKTEVVADDAAAFVERLRTERERDAAAEAARESAHRVDAWLDDAERTLAPRPAPEPESPDATTPRFADGYEHEAWRAALEALVTQGRTTVREAVESRAVEPQAAAQVRDAMERLERVLADEQGRGAERLAVARTQAWLAGWVDAEDPEDPFRSRSPTATVEEGRRIAADPALTDDWRRAVIEVVDSHDAREEGGQRCGAVASGLGTVRAGIHRPGRRPSMRRRRRCASRALARFSTLPHCPWRSNAASPPSSPTTTHTTPSGGREEQRIEPATDVARRLEDYRLDAARDAARRSAAETLHESDAIRRGLDRHSRDGAELEESVEQCHALAAAARRLSPNLPPAEASNLAEAVRDAGHRLRRWLAEARRHLQFVRDWFERGWPNHYHDQLRAAWDAHRASHDFYPEDIERHRPWIDAFRDLARDPHLDRGNREALDTLLHDYDAVWPRERQRCVEALRRWNDLTDSARGGYPSEMSGYDALIEELRAVATMDTLANNERELIHAALRTHDEHRKKSRQWSMDIGM